MAKITPHKGGRTKQKKCTLTETELELLNAELERTGLSFADWVVGKLIANYSPLIEPLEGGIKIKLDKEY